MALPLLPTPIIPLPKQQQSFPSNIRRRATTVSAELQTAVVRTGGIDYQFPSVDAPTHKVTVHDRQRGIVHEFVVPEVPSFESTIFIDVITSLFSILCCSCLLLILYLILFLYYRILIFVCDITKKLAILFLVFWKFTCDCYYALWNAGPVYIAHCWVPEYYPSVRLQARYFFYPICFYFSVIFSPRRMLKLCR